MDFAPSDQQRLLVKVARQFLEKRCPPALVQEQALDARGFREELWREMAELGWPGLLIPSALGGSEASLLDVALLVEEMGRACLPGPFVPSAVVATSILIAAARDETLRAMATGERRATLAIVEEGGSFDAASVAMPGAAPGRLDGRKLFVKDAHLADFLVIVARGDGGLNLFLIETGRRGVTLAPMPTMTGEKLFEVTFTGVEVEVHDRLGSPGRGLDLLAPALRAGALARAAEMVGAAGRVLELAVEHAKTRVQFGRPIGAFQAIQHICADMVGRVDGARAIVLGAAWSLASGYQAAQEVAMAKAYAGQACLAVARRAHQVFGAIGYCEEHLLHVYHKRILAGSLDFGDRALHLETVARAIGLRA